MGQIKVIKSEIKKKKFVFRELKTGEVFLDGKTLYLKIDQDTVFNLTDMYLSPSKVNPALDVYPVNATLTVHISFNRLQVGEVFKLTPDGFTYLKVDVLKIFCFECKSLETMLDGDMEIFPVNATLTVEE